MPTDNTDTVSHISRASSTAGEYLQFNALQQEVDAQQQYPNELVEKNRQLKAEIQMLKEQMAQLINNRQINDGQPSEVDLLITYHSSYWRGMGEKIEVKNSKNVCKPLMFS